jgi:hypothetical protein
MLMDMVHIKQPEHLIFNVKYLGNTALDYNTGSPGTTINLHVLGSMH